jgi:hypothetical protein
VKQNLDEDKQATLHAAREVDPPSLRWIFRSVGKSRETANGELRMANGE